METDTLVAPVSTPPPVEPPDATPPAESIADHAEQFSPSARELANTGQFANKPPDAKPGYKAQSQRATPEDVQEINRLTRELRETEARLKDKDPDASASPRIKTLKRQIAALRALEAPAPEPKPEPKPVAPSPPPQAAPSGATFDKKRPDINDFANEPEPFDAYNEALVEWKLDKREWERTQAHTSQQAMAQEQELIGAFNTRTAEFTKTKADYQTVTQPFMARELPVVLLNAIVRDDNGPAYVYHLAQHPEVADELILLTEGKPFSDSSVAVVQRRLKQALSASGTAAQLPDRPPVTPAYIPPKPPNPVRTGPIKTVDDPPGETASIADHAKYYGPKRR